MKAIRKQYKLIRHSSANMHEVKTKSVHVVDPFCGPKNTTGIVENNYREIISGYTI